MSKNKKNLDENLDEKFDNKDTTEIEDAEYSEEIKEDSDDNQEKVEDTENANEETKEETKEKTEEEDWKNKYIRLLAEFDNFRKRTEKEKQTMIGFGASMILGKFLPLIDNMDRAEEALSEEDKKTSMGEGLDKIYKQLQKLLEEMDVKPIKAVGEKFDPAFHNAVMTDEESDAEVDTITQELQKGYTYKDDVLRHTMVKVKK